MIKKGKFKEEVDADGDTIYIKAKRFRSEKVTDANTAATNRKTRVDEDEAAKVEEAMDDWWHKNQVGLAGGSSTMSTDDDGGLLGATMELQFLRGPGLRDKGSGLEAWGASGSLWCHFGVALGHFGVTSK